MVACAIIRRLKAPREGMRQKGNGSYCWSLSEDASRNPDEELPLAASLAAVRAQKINQVLCDHSSQEDAC